MRSSVSSLRRVSFDAVPTDAQTLTVLRWVHRFLAELRFAETGELHVNHLEGLFFSVTEALFHGRKLSLFQSDQPWPDRAVFSRGPVREILPIRTLAEKTRFLVKALEQVRMGLAEPEGRLVEQLADYLRRILPERERGSTGRPGPRAVGRGRFRLVRTDSAA